MIIMIVACVLDFFYVHIVEQYEKKKIVESKKIYYVK